MALPTDAAPADDIGDRVVEARGPRAELALLVGRMAGALSRSLRLGSGSVVGGRLALAIEPRLVSLLTNGRQVALVSGTNGKTTTTRFLVEALAAGAPAGAASGGGPPAPARAARSVAYSPAGANMPAGIVAALGVAPPSAPAVLELDEAYLPGVLGSTRPAVVLLLNLSRDQLDRISEVRMLAASWARALAGFTGTVVANADDPLVVWAAGEAPATRFVGAGQLWRSDAHHCPACDARIEVADPEDDHSSWRCPNCGLARPPTVAELTEEGLVFQGGERFAFELEVPGRFNRANAALACVAAQAMGRPPGASLAAICAVRDVAGRFAVVRAGDHAARLMLAKNPAGWTELVELLAAGTGPLVSAINARLADGQDPSWLWDVPFERLAGRFVVATGDRRLDLAVRLLHAGVSHVTVAEPLEAIERAASACAAPGGTDEIVDAVGNYTAFQDLRRQTTPLSALGIDPHGELGAPSRRPQPAPGPGPRPVVPLEPAGTPTGSPRTGSARTGSARTGSPRTGSARTGSPRTGSPRTSSPRTGPPRIGGASALRVVVVHPDLLGTYGDGGNGQVLANRALWHGLQVELVLASSDRPLPETGDCYCLGGGEDGPQLRSAEVLRHGALARAVAGGAAVLAVCAGFQIAGTSFPGAAGGTVDGLELIDATTTRSRRPRAVGEVLARPSGRQSLLGGAALLSGFENHASTTTLGPGVAPLAEVLRGTGNDGAGSEGAVAGRLVGTYLHGPVLARNPALADALLVLVTGRDLEPLDDEEESALRAERLAAATGRRFAVRRTSVA